MGGACDKHAEAGGDQYYEGVRMGRIMASDKAKMEARGAMLEQANAELMAFTSKVERMARELAARYGGAHGT